MKGCIIMKKSISFIFIVSVFLTCFFVTAHADDFQLRNGIIFGDTLDIVKQKETLPYKKSNESNVKVWFGDGKISGIDGQVRFDFSEDTGELIDMLYSFASSEKKDFVDNDYSKLQSGLIRKYGSPLNNPNGKLNIITGPAFEYSSTVIVLFQYIKGDGDIRDYDEWIVHCDGYNVKIDLVSYYYRDKDYKYTYANLLSYHYFTDDDSINALKQQQEEIETIDNDL